MRTHSQPVIRAIGVSHTACKDEMNFDKIFDLTAGVFFIFIIYVSTLRLTLDIIVWHTVWQPMMLSFGNDVDASINSDPTMSNNQTIYESFFGESVNSKVYDIK